MSERLSDEALKSLLANAERDSTNSELAEFQRALDPSGGTVTPSVIIALVLEVQEARRTRPTEGVRLTPMEQQQRAANGAPYGYSPLWPLVKP